MMLRRLRRRILLFLLSSYVLHSHIVFFTGTTKPGHEDEEKLLGFNLDYDGVNYTLPKEDLDIYPLLEKGHRTIIYLRPELNKQQLDDHHQREGRESSSCTHNTMEVLSYLVNEVNARNGTLILTYGGLLHVCREKSLVNPDTGEFWDDDIDMWANLETAEIILSLENVLYEMFGWTIRCHAIGPYAVFMQLFSACQYDVVQGKRKAKMTGNTVSIEIYLILTVPMVPTDSGFRHAAASSPGDNDGHGEDQGEKVWDTFSRRSLPTSMVYPTQHINLQWSGKSSEEPLHLQLPNDSGGLLYCVYGNWLVPSSKQRVFHENPTDYTGYYDAME
mmetsp:Transcript_38009/g.80067  ORF Transcript_38009/g.80067 Transcript_38009/m.80067 type:complete len:332 (-) Transcript_38009:215-1210(-)